MIIPGHFVVWALGILVGWCLGWPVLSEAQTADPFLSETPEIQFASDEARKLRETADALGSSVAIYEHVRNTYEY